MKNYKIYFEIKKSNKFCLDREKVGSLKNKFFFIERKT